MRPVSPNLGGDEVMIAEDQLEYSPLAAVRVSDDAWLMRWTFTPDERRRVAEGEDITVTMPHHVHPYSVRLLGDSV